MELKDFIKSTIVAICDGIAEAKEITNSKYNNGIVAPGRFNNLDVSDRYNIDFKIGITIEETKTKDGGISAKLKIINLDKNTDSKTVEAKINNIAFSVPYFPQGFNAYGSYKK